MSKKNKEIKNERPPSLGFAMKHFHKDKTTIETLYHRDEEFQCLCADYRDGMKAKEYWCRSATENARMLCEEYKLLCTELEAEIEKWLREYDNR